MSLNDSDRLETTVSTKGITIRKWVEIDQSDPVVVTFEIYSEHDGTTWIRVTDPLPKSIPPSDIGLHPDYGIDYWSIESETVVFEREFEPGEEYTTLYGIRGFEGTDWEFLDSLRADGFAEFEISIEADMIPEFDIADIR